MMPIDSRFNANPANMAQKIGNAPATSSDHMQQTKKHVVSVGQKRQSITNDDQILRNARQYGN